MRIGLEKLRYEEYCYKSRLSDEAILRGIVKMSNLKTVEISVASNVSV